MIAGSVGLRVGDVDALVAAGDRGRAHARRPSRCRPLGHEPRHAVADDELRALGDETAEVVERDADGVGVGVAAVAAEDDPLAGLEPALDGVAREPQLRALQVEQQADGPPGPLGRLAQLDRAAAQLVRVPCEQLMRAQSMPAAMSWSSIPGPSVAGPSVATILVRRGCMP